MDIKRLIIAFACACYLRTEAANPTLAGSNVFSGQNTDTNRWTVNGNFLVITNVIGTNGALFIPTNDITITGASNGLVNGNFHTSYINTNAQSYSWTNSKILSTTNVYVIVSNLIVLGPAPVAGLYNSFGSATMIYTNGGTNYLLSLEYDKPGGVKLLYKSSQFSAGWGFIGGSYPLYLPQLLYGRYDNNIVLPDNGWITFNGSTTIPIVSGGMNLSSTTTNVSQTYSYITNLNYGSYFQLVLISADGNTFLKDSNQSNPNGHWTQFIGIGDTNVTGSATAYSSNPIVQLYLTNQLFLTGVTLGNASPSSGYINLSGVTISNWTDLPGNLFNLTTLSNYFNSDVDTNAGLTVTNWTIGSITSLSYNTVYTNLQGAGILYGVNWFYQQATAPIANETTVFYTNNGVGHSFHITGVSVTSNDLYFKAQFSIPLNYGSTLMFTNTEGAADSEFDDVTFWQLPH